MLDEGSPLLVPHPLDHLDLDRLLEERLGEFGRYQKLVYLLVCLPAALSAAVTMANVFTDIIPQHRCQVGVCDSPLIPHYEDAFTLGYANFSIPRTQEGHWESCSKFIELSNKTCSSASFSANTSRCDKILYSQVEMKTTIVTEFNLVCEEDWKVPFGQSIFFGGVLAGAVVFGQLGDLIGRKKVYLLSILQTTVCGILAVFSTDFRIYSLLQFLTAMAQTSIFQSAFILGIELVGRKRRVFCGVMINYFFILGELMLVGIAWALRDWKKMTLAYLVPSTLFLGYYFILPGSIRWLIANRKYRQAEIELNKIARWNGVSGLSSEDFKQFKKQEVESEEKETIIHLFRRPKLVLRLLIVVLCWLVTTMVYYGLSLDADDLAGDVFLNFTLLALTEIPGYTLSYLGMTYLGRKPTLMFSLILSGGACLVSGLVPSSWTATQTAFFLIGKFGVASAFGTVFLYTSELFPTSIRNLCVGLSSMVGRIGAMVSPYISQLGMLTGLPWLPLVVFAVAAILSGISVIFLHETKGKGLPRNLAEAEHLEDCSAPSGSEDDLTVEE